MILALVDVIAADFPTSTSATIMGEEGRAWDGGLAVLVQRAAKAPIDGSGSVTSSLKDRQKGDGHRALRKAPVYGWKVAPASGLPVFQALQRNPDPDVRWIVTANSKKARLAKLLG